MKHTLIFKTFFGLLIVLVTQSCSKDFIVKDIKNETVSIVAPADNLTTPNNTITFWWEELDGAEKYTLQLVKPSFNSVQQLVFDTTVIGTKFKYTLMPGTYQWRINASNTGGSTAYTTRTLIIDSTSNLSLVTVGLVAPADYSVTANSNLTFVWNPVSADHYELNLTNSSNSVTIIPSITSTSYPYVFNVASGSEETYTWFVKAFNSTTGTQTINNTTRVFKIDRKAPFLPIISTPNTYSMQVSDTVYLKWNRNSGSLDIEYDVVSISSDSTFASLLGPSQNVSSGNQIQIKSIYTYTGAATPIWWRVSSVDCVGNISTPVQSKRLYLK